MRALQIGIRWFFAAIFLMAAVFLAVWWLAFLAVLAFSAALIAAYLRYVQKRAGPTVMPERYHDSSPPLPIERLTSLAEKDANIGTSVVCENQRPAPPAPVQGHPAQQPPTPDVHVVPPPRSQDVTAHTKNRLLNLK